MNRLDEISKLLSFVLRHSPEAFGLEMADDGWVSVEDFIQRANERGHCVSLSDIENIVANSKKKRFEFSNSGSDIRALQGHSISVTIDFVEMEPPQVLYHGTVPRFLPSIQANGLSKMKRQFVHLSPTVDTARVVGSRRGKPVILIIHSSKMHASGFKFFRAKNDVWLVDSVPPQYIEVEHPKARD